MTTVTENPVRMERRILEERFEFVLYINDHIICQRYFNIRDYNEESVQSLELKDLMDNIIGMNINKWGELGIIPKHLKQKSVDYLWDSYNPYFVQNEDSSKVGSDKIDDFQFEIKIDKKVVAKGGFSGNHFQPKVRYAVDVREIIPSIMHEIRTYLSQKNYTKVVA